MPLAAARAGCIHVPINPLLKRAQVAHILADSGAVLLIASPRVWPCWRRAMRLAR
jgi:acyl-coenzyme A synthetase/AMP-(fatty) acid ligase